MNHTELFRLYPGKRQPSDNDRPRPPYRADLETYSAMAGGRPSDGHRPRPAPPNASVESIGQFPRRIPSNKSDITRPRETIFPTDGRNTFKRISKLRVRCDLFGNIQVFGGVIGSIGLL
jgi:hypothetical protein